MARGRPGRESGHESDSSDSSSGSSSSNSSSSDSSGKSSRENSPDQRDRRKTERNGKTRRQSVGSTEGRGRQLKEGSPKQRGKDKSRHVSGDSPRHRGLREEHKRVPRSPSHSPPVESLTSPKQHSRGIPRSPSESPPSTSEASPPDVHMSLGQRASGARSEDELSIGPADSDGYQDELAKEADIASQEISKKSKPRREDLSSGEVTSDGDSDDSFSWRENRVRTMLQSHVQKPSNEGPRRESYDRYDSDHEGAQPFRSVVGTTITRPGQQYSDSDSGEITDSEDEGERDRRRVSKERYSRRSGSPSRRSNQAGRDKDQRGSRTQESSTNRHIGDRDERAHEGKDRLEHESSREKRRGRRRSKDRSQERTEGHKKGKHKEHKKDERYEDARVKFRKRVWDKKEEEAQEKKKTNDEPLPEEDKKVQPDNKENGEPPPPKKKKEEPNVLTMRTGGAYIPPAKLRMMQEQITDKSSEAYQRMAWEALKKSINGLINKVNVPNIAQIVQELLQLNIVRGRGCLARSIIQAQTASPTFTHVYAALIAVLNTKFPQNGELLLRRLVVNFKKGYRRNNKTMCISATRFIAHLVNQQVAHEILALEILTLLLENVTDDSVEVAVGFVKECGLKLQEVSPRGIHAIFERMRSILHEAQIEKRVQYMVEVVFANRKDGFKDFPSIVPELDLVEENEQFTHLLTLEENYQEENLLNVFKMDPDYLENEEKYKAIKKEILDEGSDESGSDEESGEASSSEEESDEEKAEEQKMEIIDQTETNLVALRRTIYLTIQSSLDFEECAHKMLKMEFKPGQEREVCMMMLDCCAQQRTYEKFFGLLAQRFCQLKREYAQMFESIFPEQYGTCHRLDTNKLRNVAKMFAHLLYTDAISWTVIETIRMNEEETTSSSRIFVKILFLELSEYMGLPKLNDRLKDKTLMPYFEGLLPRDNPANTRFAINFFTTIGLGGLTDDLRDHLKNVQRQIMQQRQPVLPSDSSSDSSESESESSSSSSSSSESSSDSSSGSSESDRDKSKKKKSKTVKGKSAISKRGDSEGRNKNRHRAEERESARDRQAVENSTDARRKRVDNREMEDSRTRHNDRDRERTDVRARQNDMRHNRVNSDERDSRQTRKDDRVRGGTRGSDDRIDRTKQRQQNTKQSKQRQETDSSESDSSSSEDSSSDSESSMDASPQQEAPNRRPRGHQDSERAVRPTSNDRAYQGRGGGRDMRENYSDKENQRGNRQRTQSHSDSEGFQKRRDTSRDFIRHNDKPNNEYIDHRQVRGDGRDMRRNRDNQYDRGNVRNPRTRYNSRGEDDHMNNVRNKEYSRHDRMEVEGFDRRNDRGRNRYEHDKPPRYNDDVYGRKDRRQGYAGSPERERWDYGGGSDRGMRRGRDYQR